MPSESVADSDHVSGESNSENGKIEFFSSNKVVSHYQD